MSKNIAKLKKKDKCLFNVENMDDLAKDKKQNDKSNQIHPLLPKHPFRILMVGGSGQGKSNLLINMVYKPMVVFERLYVYSAMNNQPKYKFLKRHYDMMDKMLEKDYGIKQKTIQVWNDTLEGIDKLLDTLDADKKNLIIIDDFSVCPSKQEQNAIDILYTKCRHKNTSIIILTQLYFRPPSTRPVRNNITHAILFQNFNNQELQLLQKELGSDLPRGEFRKLYNFILSEKYNFMVIDNSTDDRRLRYRNKFDGIYQGKLSNYDASYFKPANYVDSDDDGDEEEEY
jgi:hypothetical protein